MSSNYINIKAYITYICVFNNLLIHVYNNVIIYKAACCKRYTSTLELTFISGYLFDKSVNCRKCIVLVYQLVQRMPKIKEILCYLLNKHFKTKDLDIGRNGFLIFLSLSKIIRIIKLFYGLVCRR